VAHSTAERKRLLRRAFRDTNFLKSVVDFIEQQEKTEKDKGKK